MQFFNQHRHGIAYKQLGTEVVTPSCQLNNSVLWEKQRPTPNWYEFDTY